MMKLKEILGVFTILVGFTVSSVAQIIPSQSVPLYGAPSSCTSLRPVAPWQGVHQSGRADINVCEDYDRVGIGTSAPFAKLHVAGSVMVNDNLTVNKDVNINGKVNNGLMIEESSDLEDDKLLILSHLASFGGLHNRWVWGINTSGNLTLNSKRTDRAYFINPTGGVGIATECIPGNAKLAVGGKIICEEVQVRLKGANCWADYVFADNYELPSLSEVECFINDHKHLPGVPSAKKVEEDGLSVSEMLKIQMEKIEELTLYMIELKKENELLKAEISALK